VSPREAKIDKNTKLLTTMPESVDIQSLNEKICESSAWVNLLKQEMGRVIIGQKYLVDRLIIGIIANGHVLLEGVPGLAKTLSIRTLAQCIQADFQRIQFTPDLLPSDIVGTLIYNPHEGKFSTRKGPVFANLVLADEINRAPSKVQSALLEAMQERQVTIGNETFLLPDPFLVLATENPIDQEGTYPLPEAQMDRFMFKLNIGYPTREEERLILDTHANTKPAQTVRPIITPETVREARQLINQIYIDEKVRDYIVSIVFATRFPDDYKLKNLTPFIQFGASPRATIALTLAAQAHAFLQGRGYVTPQDVKQIGMDVLRHRVIVTFEAEAESITSEEIIRRIFETVPVP
jgi:MoxR-like ATPase